MRSIHWMVAVLVAGVITVSPCAPARAAIAGPTAGAAAGGQRVPGRVLRLISVALDLNVTDAQRQAARPIVINAMQQLRAVRNGGGDPATKRAAARKVVMAAWGQLSTQVLTPEQVTKILAARSQIKNLKLSPEQKHQLVGIFKSTVQQVREARASGAPVGQTRFQMFQALLLARSQVGQVLTTDQQARVNAMFDGQFATNILAHAAGLDDGQKAQVEAILGPAIARARSILNNASLSPVDRAQQLRTLSVSTREGVGAQLTPYQKQRLRARIQALRGQ